MAGGGGGGGGKGCLPSSRPSGAGPTLVGEANMSSGIDVTAASGLGVGLDSFAFGGGKVSAILGGGGSGCSFGGGGRVDLDAWLGGIDDGAEFLFVVFG